MNKTIYTCCICIYFVSINIKADQLNNQSILNQTLTTDVHPTIGAFEKLQEEVELIKKEYNGKPNYNQNPILPPSMKSFQPNLLIKDKDHDSKIKKMPFIENIEGSSVLVATLLFPDGHEQRLVTNDVFTDDDREYTVKSITNKSVLILNNNDKKSKNIYLVFDNGKIKNEQVNTKNMLIPFNR